MNAATLNKSDFEQVLAEAPSHGDQRRAAFELFDATPWPRRTDELWRRTDPSLFPLYRIERTPAPIWKEALANSPLYESFDAVVQISEEAVRVIKSSTREVALSTLEKESENLPALDPFEELDKFKLLNDSFWNVGLNITFTSKDHAPKVLVHVRPSKHGSLLIPKTIVHATANSRGKVAFLFTSPNGVENFVIDQVQVIAERDSQVELTTLQQLGDASFRIAEAAGRAEQNARIHWDSVYLGGKRTRARVSINAAGRGADIRMDGLAFTSGKEHVDHRTVQVHSAPDTESAVEYKVASQEDAHSIYQGLIVAKPGAIRVNAYQQNHNLILTKNARAASLPSLLIDADDLSCSHGATVGSLDPEQVYYLRTRGLSEAQARALLIEGYFEEIAKKVPFSLLSERIRECVKTKLNL